MLVSEESCEGGCQKVVMSAVCANEEEEEIEATAGLRRGSDDAFYATRHALERAHNVMINTDGMPHC